MPLYMKMKRKKTRRRREETKIEEMQKYLKTTEELSYIEEQEENITKEKWQRNCWNKSKISYTYSVLVYRLLFRLKK